MPDDPDRARIPVAAPDLSGSEERYVVDAIRSSWISSTGPYLERFELGFAELVGAHTALGVSNGTVALHLALESLGVGIGDEVIVPSLTYVATANACRYVGAEPVFVDVDPATWCIDPARVEEAITRRTRAIIAVHLYGHPADMDALSGIARRSGIWVIEDAAEAHGSRYKDRPVGGLADIGTFSFYGNKIITSGEGGAVTIQDPDLARHARQLRGQGVDPARRYWFPIVGHNFRLTNLAAAILCAQLERFDEIVARRWEVFEAYRRGLAGVPGMGFQPIAPWAVPAPWLFCITIDPARYGHTRDELMTLLDEQGIETRPFFVPVHQLPPYAQGDPARGGGLPFTDRLAASGMNLPTFAGLTDADIARVCDAIRRHAPD
jgi:perosamine synthetase